MKGRNTSILLLLIISSYLTIPIVPFIDFVLNKEYIVKNLCENRNKPKSCCKGKCYLVKQLKKAHQSTEETPKNTESKLKIKDLKDFILKPKPAYLAHNLKVNYIEKSLKAADQTVLSFIFIPPEII